MRMFYRSFMVASALGLIAALAGCGGSSGGSSSGGSSDTAHYAGTYYPLYNSGVGQWIEPTDSMPFDKVSAIYAAFAHAYPQDNGAVFAFEQGQPDEPARLAELEQVA